MTTMADDSDLDRIVGEILLTLGKSNVTTVYLFGSVARGDDTPGSDYDIAVVVKKYPRNDLRLISQIKSALADIVKRPVDIILLEPADLDRSPQFLYELYHNNKKLFGADILLKYRAVARKLKPSKPAAKTGPVWYHA